MCYCLPTAFLIQGVGRSHTRLRTDTRVRAGVLACAVYNDFEGKYRTCITAVYIRLTRKRVRKRVEYCCTIYPPAVVLPVDIISCCSRRNTRQQQQHSSSSNLGFLPQDRRRNTVRLLPAPSAYFLHRHLLQRIRSAVCIASSFAYTLHKHHETVCPALSPSISLGDRERARSTHRSGSRIVPCVRAKILPLLPDAGPRASNGRGGISLS